MWVCERWKNITPTKKESQAQTPLRFLVSSAICQLMTGWTSWMCWLAKMNKRPRPKTESQWWPAPLLEEKAMVKTLTHLWCSWFLWRFCRCPTSQRTQKGKKGRKQTKNESMVRRKKEKRPRGVKMKRSKCTNSKS